MEFIKHNGGWIVLWTCMIIGVGFFAFRIITSPENTASQGAADQPRQRIAIPTVHNKMVLGFNGPFAIAFVIIALVLLNGFVFHWNPFGFRDQRNEPAIAGPAHSSSASSATSTHCMKTGDADPVPVTKGDTAWIDVPEHCTLALARLTKDEFAARYERFCRTLAGEEVPWTDEACKQATADGYVLKADSTKESDTLYPVFQDYM